VEEDVSRKELVLPLEVEMGAKGVGVKARGDSIELDSG
jgi:hypothetical protein